MGRTENFVCTEQEAGERERGPSEIAQILGEDLGTIKGDRRDISA